TRSRLLRNVWASSCSSTFLEVYWVRTFHRVHAKDNYAALHGAKVPNARLLASALHLSLNNRENFTRVPERTRRDTWPSMMKCTTSIGRARWPRCCASWPPGFRGSTGRELC